MSTCTPLRPFFHPYVDEKAYGWVFQMEPPLEVPVHTDGTNRPATMRAARFIAVHRDAGFGGDEVPLMVCYVRVVEEDKRRDHGAPVSRAAARTFLDTYFADIQAVLDLGGKP